MKLWEILVLQVRDLNGKFLYSEVSGAGLLSSFRFNWQKLNDVSLSPDGKYFTFCRTNAVERRSERDSSAADKGNFYPSAVSGW